MAAHRLVSARYQAAVPRGGIIASTRQAGSRVDDKPSRSVVPKSGGVFQEAALRIKLIARLMADRRVNPLVKLLPVGALAYWLIPDIAPGTECIAISCHDNNTNMIIRLSLFKKLVPEGDHLIAKGIFNLRPINGDDGDISFNAIEYMRFTHFSSPHDINLVITLNERWFMDEIRHSIHTVINNCA